MGNRNKAKTIPILVVHWGSRGGGPKFAFSAARALSRIGSVELHLSISSHVDLLYEWLSSFSRVSLVKTYRSKLGAILRLPSAVIQCIKLRAYIKQHSIQVVWSPMISLWHTLLIPIWKPMGVKYYGSIHDASEHLGEESLLQKLLRNNEFKYSEKVIAYSDFVANAINRQDGTDKTVTLFHPLDSPRVQKPIFRETLGGDFVVGFAGRILPYKGVDLFLEVAKISLDLGDGINFRICGFGDLGDLQVPKNVMVTAKWFEQDELISEISKFDILLLPYREASQSGLISISASLAIPVVVTPVGGLKEQVEKHFLGLVTESLNPELIYARIGDLHKNTALYNQVSASCYGGARARLSWDSFAQLLLTSIKDSL